MHASSDDWEEPSIPTDSPVIFIFYTHKKVCFDALGISQKNQSWLTDFLSPPFESVLVKG